MSFNPRQDTGSVGLVYDKIYSSVAEMERHSNNDGVVIGRYVMISSDDADNTAVYQKRADYNKETGKYTILYKYVTHLGITNSPIAPSSFVTTDDKCQFHYMHSQEDPWIEINPKGQYKEMEFLKDGDNYLYDSNYIEMTQQKSELSTGPIITHKPKKSLINYKITQNGNVISETELTSEVTIGGFAEQNGVFYIKIPVITVDECGHINSIEEQQLPINDIHSLIIEEENE